MIKHLAHPHVFYVAFLTRLAWFKWPNSLCHFLALSRCCNSSWTLECCTVSKTNFFLESALPAFFAVSCIFFFPLNWSYAPNSCLWRLTGGLQNSQSQIKHSYLELDFPFVWGHADPHKASGHWTDRHKDHKHIYVCHYVVHATTVH